jgi:hypothetical protein
MSVSSWFYYKEICHDARSHVTMHGQMNVKNNIYVSKGVETRSVYYNYNIFEFITERTMSTLEVFWDFVLYGLVGNFRLFTETSCFNQER